MQFVWLYVNGPDNGSELRLSMRSVVQNVAGDNRLTVVGDKPSWYRGHYIPVGRISKMRGVRRENIPFVDTKNKIQVAATHPEIEENFIHIMDDVYMLQPTTVDELSKARFDPWFRGGIRRPWHRLIASTFSALREQGYPTLQGATHLPHRFEKQKLNQMFEEFRFSSRLILFELLYFNRFRDNAEPYPPFLRRLQRPEPAASLTKIASESTVLNYVSSCWNRTTKAWLFQKYTNKTEFEE